MRPVLLYMNPSGTWTIEPSAAEWHQPHANRKCVKLPGTVTSSPLTGSPSNGTVPQARPRRYRSDSHLLYSSYMRGLKPNHYPPVHIGKRNPCTVFSGYVSRIVSGLLALGPLFTPSLMLMHSCGPLKPQPYIPSMRSRRFTGAQDTSSAALRALTSSGPVSRLGLRKLMLGLPSRLVGRYRRPNEHSFGASCV